MSYTGPGGGDGSYTIPGAGGTIFSPGISIELQSQALGLADPSDSPTTSQIRAVKGDDGKYTVQVWDAAGGVWVGVELT